MMRGDDKGARMANAMAVVAGRAARACDVCARKRSRWYCAADEAYLCDACDSSVHAANALALRHERVRLSPNGTPMKIERRINTGENPSAAGKKKAKGRVAPSSHSKYVSSNPNGVVRDVKEESYEGGNSNTEIDPSDDHFTAEELTGNANILDDTPSSGARYENSSCHPGSGTEGDFTNFLVSDPNDPNNCTDWEVDTDRMKIHTPSGTTSSAGAGDVVDDDNEVCDGAGDDWMHLDPEFASRDSALSDSDDYCIDPVALRGSASTTSGAFDQSLALYGHEEKPPGAASSGLPTASARGGKPFKNSAGHSEWVKQEDGYQSYGQALSNNPSPVPVGNNTSCKLELALNECDSKQVPSLRLNYDDVLSSWPDRDFRWSDDGTYQLVPDDSNPDAMGPRYDIGLVPDLSNGGYGVDAHGNPTALYGGCGPGSMGGGGGAGGDDSAANAGNAREVRVNRYREKRRTRLFSKKIRYEVRKLNAERRPRMKGRFVKRSPVRES